MTTALKILIIVLIGLIIYGIIDHEQRTYACRTAGGVYVQGFCFKPEALFPR